MAAPRRKPELNDEKYMFDDDREHLYLTLHAAFVAAKRSGCHVLVL
jgi:hypothetical protein